MPDPTNEHAPELRTMLRGHQVEFACLGMRGNGNLGRVAETCTLLAVDHSLDFPYFTKKHGWISGEVYKPASPPMLAGVGEWVEYPFGDVHEREQVVAVECIKDRWCLVIVGYSNSLGKPSAWIADAITGEQIGGHARITAVYANKDDEAPIVSAEAESEDPEPKYRPVTKEDGVSVHVVNREGKAFLKFETPDKDFNKGLGERGAERLNDISSTKDELSKGMFDGI